MTKSIWVENTNPGRPNQLWYTQQMPKPLGQQYNMTVIEIFKEAKR